MLNTEVIKSINESVLCWLATANDKGEPNVSPKEMFISNGSNNILIANIASPTSILNINVNPSVCVSFIDIFKQKGFKVRGIAKVIEKNHNDFYEKEAILHSLGGEEFTIKNIIEISVSDVSPIIAPSYFFFPDTTESSQKIKAFDSYGVIPKK